jgi:hypothetical protein
MPLGSVSLEILSKYDPPSCSFWKNILLSPALLRNRASLGVSFR